MAEAPTLAAPYGNLAAAAAAVAEDTSFDLSAWEAAAAAAAHAAANDGIASASNAGGDLPFAAKSGTHTTTSVCWAVAMLSQALAAAEEPRSSVQHLLLLPAGKAAAQLLQLSAAERAGQLLLLCGGSSGTRGDAWLGHVLADVQHRLGLLEMGVVLAAVYHR
jgi:hypothetical protein